MEKQKVFIPVEDKLFNINNGYVNNSIPPFQSIDVKQEEGYFFTSESLKELVSECVGFVLGRYGTEKDRDEQCKKLIKSLNIK